MWVRGLKSAEDAAEDAAGVVAPHVGAWIEIIEVLCALAEYFSRTPCGCVD